MKRVLLWFFALLLMAQANAFAQNRTASLKAAYIYYFTKFIYWPNPSDVRYICLSGQDPSLNLELNKVQQKAGKSLVVHWLQEGEAADECDLLFLLRGEWQHPRAGAGTLLVVDEGLQNPNAAVSLVLNGTKLGFDINRTNAKANNLEISAKLLGLARRVEP